MPTDGDDDLRRLVQPSLSHPPCYPAALRCGVAHPAPRPGVRTRSFRPAPRRRRSHAAPVPAQVNARCQRTSCACEHVASGADLLDAQLDAQSYATCVAPIWLHHLDDDLTVVATPNVFVRARWSAGVRRSSKTRYARSLAAQRPEQLVLRGTAGHILNSASPVRRAIVSMPKRRQEVGGAVFEQAGMTTVVPLHYTCTTHV